MRKGKDYFVYKVEKNGNTSMKECTPVKKDAIWLRDSYKSNGFDSFVKKNNIELVIN